MSDDMRARADAPGSREPSPDGLGPSDFDPSRWQDERAALIWALHFFALLAKDADNYASAPRGAWMWSELFAYKEGPDGKYDIDDEPAITERIPDDTSLLGINHEHFGGCYTWGLSMGLFRRAAEVLRLTGDVDQYSPEQQKRFRDWLWKGGDVPSPLSPSPNPNGDKE